MNKMKDVASVFGKRLNQVFYITEPHYNKVKCRFSENGLEIFTGVWYPHEGWLVALLTGEATIV